MSNQNSTSARSTGNTGGRPAGNPGSGRGPGNGGGWPSGNPNMPSGRGRSYNPSAKGK